MGNNTNSGHLLEEGAAEVGGQLQAVTRFKVTLRRSPRVPVASVGSWAKGFRAERSSSGSSGLSLEASGI